MSAERPFVGLADLVSAVRDGMMVALPKEESGVAMEAERELIRRGVKRLHILCVPAAGLQADMLIGAGCVETIECAGVIVGEIGVGPRFRAAIRDGRLAIKDSTCPVIHSGLQAGAKGAPFASVRGILGSDLVGLRKEWRVVDNPFADGGDPILLVPALNPDVFLFHARWGDRHGNAWIAGRRDLAYTAHAARTTLVTFEEIWDGNLLSDPIMAAGTLSSAYIGALAHVPRGTWPLGLQHVHAEDTPHIRDYMRLAQTDEGFAAYLRDHVLDRRAAA